MLYAAFILAWSASTLEEMTPAECDAVKAQCDAFASGMPVVSKDQCELVANEQKMACTMMGPMAAACEQNVGIAENACEESVKMGAAGFSTSECMKMAGCPAMELSDGWFAPATAPAAAPAAAPARAPASSPTSWLREMTP